MIGDQYLERGKPVVVLVAWRSGGKLVDTTCNTRHKLEAPICIGVEIHGAARGGPRNVLIQREDGSLVVRPFRGLRKPKPVKKVAKLRKTRLMR